MSRTLEHEPPDEATMADYFANRLASARAEEFEAYCLRHPDFARQVELDLILKLGFKQLTQTQAVRRATHRRRISLAIAAGLALIVGCGLLLLHRAQPGNLIAYRMMEEMPLSVRSGPRMGVTLIRVRQAAPVHRIVAPREGGILTLRVAPDLPPGLLGYVIGVALEPGVGSRATTLDKLKPDADGYVDVYLPFASLAGHTVQINLSQSPPEGAEPLIFHLEVLNAQEASSGPP
jgi:hypothetical protein